MSNPIVTRLYKHTLAAARRLDSSLLLHDPKFKISETRKFLRFVPQNLQGDEFLEEAENSTKKLSCEWLVRTSFLQAKTKYEAPTFTDNCFAAMKKLNERYDLIQSKPLTAFRKPRHIELSAGQIFRHKKYGYRGVIVCHFSGLPFPDPEFRTKWVNCWGPFEKGLDQAFYTALIDTKDRPGRMITLSASENLEPLEGDIEPVTHPDLPNYFEGFEFGHHRPIRKVYNDFPEDW
mmetsp:Transcript_1852/g.2387  ORF Transcript_1852/g.2387 Transcript_1852/m.2387 type:complete len:234 (+) Transcript_1852:122-823(+)|eukprot:CAMPEP_0204823814 /NCGR_PEP_ID=MMETSP1346-20131115/1878_1 /ASSEMBLY_ACC=CAM_ASM_000771 /TAXON_ID=215587 /ORGANISM="Aplanochytrium stocchinoi, Strain GSBS06" /LENGTH=233 /DNA_ID=CAMNT_0051950619 /DNA_START=299 /DNA_END=1000 /DNA_ORIENTATION=+